LLPGKVLSSEDSLRAGREGSPQHVRAVPAEVEDVRKDVLHQG
jgi:hypothetical protein